MKSLEELLVPTKRMPKVNFIFPTTQQFESNAPAGNNKDLNSSMKNILNKIQNLKHEVQMDKYDEFLEKTMFPSLIKNKENQDNNFRKKENIQIKKMELTFSKDKRLKLRRKIETNICLPLYDPLVSDENKVKKQSNQIFSCTNLDEFIRMQNKLEQAISVYQSKEQIQLDNFCQSETSLHEITQQPLQISDFQLGENIGSGKFGDVYFCRHKKTNWTFALKKILKSTIIQYNMLDQFINELKIQYKLNHQNIVKLYSHFCDQYHIFLLMEYAPGGTLMNHLKNSEIYASQLLSQMLEAIRYIHHNHIIHRDIKPQNIVVFFDGTFKLCDFGLSAYLSPNKDVRTSFCGTLDYIAPQMKDIGLYNCSVDIWGLGVLTYEVLIGSAPFKDQISNWKKRGGRRHSNWNWKIVYPPEISSRAVTFMENLLKQDPHARMSIACALNSQFIKQGHLPLSRLTDVEQKLISP